jgi:hypothetical protein
MADKTVARSKNVVFHKPSMFSFVDSTASPFTAETNNSRTSAVVLDCTTACQSGNAHPEEENAIPTFGLMDSTDRSQGLFNKLSLHNLK